ncbi:lipase/thioesterase [Aspergillus egyptiacus]|nr:lipase/thioesterase [Aspergillus egyptiacus]
MAIFQRKLLITKPYGFADKLSLAWRIPLLIIRCTANFSSICLSHGEASALNWRQKLAIACLQASRTTFTSKEDAIRSRKPLTGPRIQKYCQRHNLKHRSVSLGGGTPHNKGDAPPPVLHFVTGPAAQAGGPTILYSHGGGYHSPIRAEGHIPFVMLCAEACKAEQVVFLEYSLSPDEHYPCQLIQAVAGLRFLLEKKGIQANNIILGGDSAGAHLTASLLAHIAQPSPHATPVDLRGSQFKAVFLVSPWLTMSEEQGKALPQARNDYLTRERISQFRDMFKPVLSEIWSNPYEAEGAAAVWSRFVHGRDEHTICRKVILAVGTSEILLESCLNFGRDFIGCKSVRVDTKADLELVKDNDFVLAIASGEAHVQPALDCAVRYYDGRMLKAILAFLETC